MGMRTCGYMHAGAMEVEAVRGLSWKEAMGIYACGGYGSRSREGGCHGNEAKGRGAGGGEQEEEGRRRRRRRWDFHLKSNRPSLRGGE